MMVAIAAVVLYKEVGPFWDVASDLLSYVCGWQVVFCTIALLLKDNQLFESKDAEATASGLLIFLQALIILIAISAQFTTKETSSRVTQSGRFTKSREGNVLAMPTIAAVSNMPRLSMAAASKLPSLPAGLVTTPRGSLYTPRGTLFRQSEASVRNSAGEKAMPAVKSDGASKQGSNLFTFASGSGKVAPMDGAPPKDRSPGGAAAKLPPIDISDSDSAPAASSLSIIESGKEMDIANILASAELDAKSVDSTGKTTRSQHEEFPIEGEGDVKD